ncbi:MAG: lysylphosphatidylglycerol synthase domain-containing protein [Gemmatimonadota bacterium]|nr:lysylphosphatidylglycerol synthase domain-containing protein [Gemmatimonadota bacterium]
MNGAQLKRVLGSLLVAAALGFLVSAVARDLPRLREFPWQLHPLPLALSTLALSVILGWGVWVWQLVLRRFGVRIPYLALCRIWFLSNLARYVPGKIWQLVGVAQLGAASGLPPAVGITSLVVQMGFTLLAAGGISLLFLPESLLPPGSVPLLRWLAPLLLLLVHPRLIRAALAVAERLARRPLARWSGGWHDGVLLVSMNAASWLLYGAALHLFISALVPIPSGSTAALAAMNALAFVAGYLVFVAPAGIGAKELALAGLLSALLPASVAAALALAVRLWTVVAEIIPALLLLGGGGRGRTTGR